MMSFFLRSGLILFVLSVQTAVVVTVSAQETVTTDVVAAPESVPVPETAVVEEAAPVSEEDPAVTEALTDQVTDVSGEDANVSLDFKEADIRNVLKILAIKSGLNIVTTPDVQALVTVQLTDVPWEEALSVIVSTYGYAYERKGKIIIVSTIEDLKKRREDAISLAEQEELMTDTFVLNFAKAETVIESLKKLNSSRGTIDFDQRTNMLIVTDIEDKVIQIGEAVKRLDTTTPQILIEGKIVETTFNDSENFGINWVTTATISGSKRPHNWPFADSEPSRFATDVFPGAEDTDFAYGTLDLSAVTAVFDMLKSRSNTNIISNPRIVTLNNQKATINVGQQYPIPTYTYNEEQGALQVSGWEYKDIGVIFEVTPYANEAGFISMTIKPEVTSFTETVRVENTDLPLINNQSVETQVMIKHGETLVIAGLVKTNKTDARSHVPFVGRIPVVNFFFKNKDITDDKTDLMIFLTPHIVTPEIETASAE